MSLELRAQAFAFMCLDYDPEKKKQSVVTIQWVRPEAALGKSSAGRAGGGVRF